MKNERDYPYVGQPLTSLIAADIILELYDGKVVSSGAITDTVIESHLQRGGESPLIKVSNCIKLALRYLKEQGDATNIIQHYWRLGDAPDHAYKYVDVPLIPTVCTELILELFDGEVVKAGLIADKVIQTHLEQGGQPPTMEPWTCVKWGFIYLRESGDATNIIQHYWRIGDAPDHAYKYVDVPLIPTVFSELILELFQGKTASREEIMSFVREEHLRRGGKDTEGGIVGVFKKTTRHLSKKGFIENTSRGKWTIQPGASPVATSHKRSGKSKRRSRETPRKPARVENDKIRVEREIGEGSGSVYVFYYPSDKALAELRGDDIFRCKVGFSDVDSVERVMAQISDAKTAILEYPVIGLIIKTEENPYFLEKHLQFGLKYQGRHVDAPAKEAFLTSPAEVEQIYRAIDGI